VLISKCIKSTLKYFLIFIITVALLFIMLILISKIPRSNIENNLKESVSFFESKWGLQYTDKNRTKDYTIVDYYLDSLILNIIYSIDTNKTIESCMWAKYYETMKVDLNNDFIQAVKEEKQPNQQYLRYWHGSMIVLRPILTMFNIEEIYLVNKIIMYALTILLFILLLKRNKQIAIIYFISMIMIAFKYVPMCLTYSLTFYIMLITSIIAILIEKYGDETLFDLFFITGILTSFFDFLTTEIITIFIPLLLVLGIRKKENRITSFKEGFIFMLKSILLWGMAYIGMWFSKWIIASFVLNINAFEYVTENALLRINGIQGIESRKEMYIGALYRNFHTLFPLNAIKRISNVWKFVGMFLVILVASIDWKNIRKKWFSFLMLIIGIVPYIRYLILANHSYRHSFFTFREQIITIIALCFIVIDCFNRDLWLKKVTIKNKLVK